MIRLEIAQSRGDPGEATPGSRSRRPKRGWGSWGTARGEVNDYYRARSGYEKAVRQSVRLSNAWFIICDQWHH